MTNTNKATTRIAPSPTGALHLGNLRTFLINWALARQNGWRIILRIDDLDGPRKKPGAVEQAIDILTWIGIDWDEGPVFQSENVPAYQNALQKLKNDNMIYACQCTRSEIQNAAVSAPHGHELRYPGTCRDSHTGLIEIPCEIKNQNGRDKGSSERGFGWRVKTSDRWFEFEDEFCGSCRFNVFEEVGDFLVLTRGGDPSYQLSVVVDDNLAGISHVVRGDDLLSSTARQMYLYELLGIEEVPTYFHMPLVVGRDGRRLAKRHGDTRVSSFREGGMSADQMRGWMGRWCGIQCQGILERDEFLERFQLGHLDQKQIVYSETDKMIP